mmetsp:Transcript_75733/g.195158  ORF Transcript_75733/g.195158 Transcript_75733/m.195158 type:complete len:421 (-) Transcript_75733:8-1270(-)
MVSTLSLVSVRCGILKCSATAFASVDFPEAGGPATRTRIARSRRSLQNSSAILRTLATKPSRQTQPGGSQVEPKSSLSMMLDGSRLRSSAMRFSNSSSSSLGCTTFGSYFSVSSSMMASTISFCVDGGALSAPAVLGWSTARKYGVSIGFSASLLPTCRTSRAMSRTCTSGTRFVPGARILCSWTPHQAFWNMGPNVSSPSPYIAEAATMKPFTCEPSRLKQPITSSSSSRHSSYFEPGAGWRLAKSLSRSTAPGPSLGVCAQTIAEEMSTKTQSASSSPVLVGGLLFGSTFSAEMAKCRSSTVALNRSMTMSLHDWMVSVIFFAFFGSSRETTRLTTEGASSALAAVPKIRWKPPSGPTFRSSLTRAFPTYVSTLWMKILIVRRCPLAGWRGRPGRSGWAPTRSPGPANGGAAERQSGR